MSKKQVMKEIFEEKINKDRIYHNVLLKVEEKCNINKEKNKKLIYCITSVVAVFILGFGIILGTKILNNNLDNNKVQKYSDITMESIELHINKGERTIKDNLSNFDIRVEEANYFMIPYFECLKDLKLPKDFNTTRIYKILGRENQNWNEEIKESDYNILECWQINYYNNDKSDTRSISIFLSDKGIPGTYNCIPPKVKDCIPSKINNVELIIYEYSGENSYLVEFSYKGYGFSIETNGITEDELVELLQSIIIEDAT